MHFEILVEDASGSILIESVLPRVLDPEHSYRIHKYKGVGHLPRGLRPGTDANKRILLDQLPRLLRGYGRSLQGQDVMVVVVVDLDRKDCEKLKQDMKDILSTCHPAPLALFRIAIEEMDAWLLGDRQAIMAAYPGARVKVLDSYVQDSICDTWELLADAIYPGGSKALKKLGYPFVGQEKCRWAERIAPEIDVNSNSSKSFQVFRDGLRKATTE